MLREGFRRLVLMFFGVGIFDFPPLSFIRQLAFRCVIPCGRSPVLQSHILVRSCHGFNGHIKIARGVFIGHDVDIDCTGGVIIEDDVWISERASVHTHSHILDSNRIIRRHSATPVSVASKNESEAAAEKTMKQHNENIRRAELTLHQGCWIGAGATILPNVHSIGKHAVVGAESVVTKDVEEYAVVAGNPAVVLRYLDFGNENAE